MREKRKIHSKFATFFRRAHSVIIHRLLAEKRKQTFFSINSKRDWFKNGISLMCLKVVVFIVSCVQCCCCLPIVVATAFLIVFPSNHGNTDSSTYKMDYIVLCKRTTGRSGWEYDLNITGCGGSPLKWITYFHSLCSMNVIFSSEKVAWIAESLSCALQCSVLFLIFFLSHCALYVYVYGVKRNERKKRIPLCVQIELYNILENMERQAPLHGVSYVRF